MERAPLVVCLFYKLPGSMVLSYLSLCKQIIGMKVVMFSYYLDTLHMQVECLSLHFIQESLLVYV